MNLKYTQENLQTLVERYETMYNLHKGLHEHIIAEMPISAGASVLEVACGIALNHGEFKKFECRYHGLDISETAIAVALLTYPESFFFNIGVDGLDFFEKDSFDIVYSSSMLEHIGFYEKAIELMCKVAKERVYITFFEGLKSEGESDIKFHRWDESYISKEEYVESFGVKNADQDHLMTSEAGWYWNRYSITDVERVLSRLNLKGWEFLSSKNRGWCDKETVLVIDL